jgi:hypothetical protein
VSGFAFDVSPIASASVVQITPMSTGLTEAMLSDEQA